MAFLLTLMLLAAPALADAPTGKNERTGVFEWFLETWDDVRTQPANGDVLARQQLAKCFHCHNPSNTWKVPPIPFNDDGKLVEWLETRRVHDGVELTGRELALKLVWQEQHMPKRIIQYHERKALKEFLETFGKAEKAASP